VLARIPHLDRPLACNHEGLTAMTLTTLRNWQTQGAIANRFCLIQTYPLNTDRFVQTRDIQLINDDGIGYYVSCPPFSVILPYLVFNLLRLRPSVLGLRAINLVCHLVAAVLIYLIAISILPTTKWRNSGAVMAATLFIFLPANMWFYSNTYSWDILWQYTWILGFACW